MHFIQQHTEANTIVEIANWRWNETQWTNVHFENFVCKCKKEIEKKDRIQMSKRREKKKTVQLNRWEISIRIWNK